MKIDRLIGILAILLQQEKVTAPFLAEKFEVSRRTINRDIEDICKAGIPLVTTQGKNGGISIMEAYRVDRTLLTSSDMKSILTGLRSLDSVSGTNRYQQLMEKLSTGSSEVLASNDHILIDLSSQRKSSLAPKIELIQAAIENRHQVEFDYHYPKGESRRIIDPYLLVFHWSSWYIWGYCNDREDFRLFKLSRMVNLQQGEETFQSRPVPSPNLSRKNVFPATLEAEVVFDPEMRWRVIEDFGMESVRELEDGRLSIQFHAFNEESLFSWLLGFGNQVELIRPAYLRNKLSALAKEISEKNSN